MKVTGDQIQPSTGPLLFSTDPVVPGGPKDLSNASYNMTATDGFNLIHSLTPLSVNRTVTLPQASASLGRRITFKKLDTSTNSLLVAPNGTDTIDLLNVTYGLLNQFGAQVTLQCVSANAWTIVRASGLAPTVTKYTVAGSSGTYTKPNFAVLLQLTMVGGGGGGAGGANTGGAGPQNGGVGGTTTFGTSSCVGGNGGLWNSQPNTGGDATIGAGAYGLAIKGAWSTAGSQITGAATYLNGGNGAASPLGGTGSGSYANTNGKAAVANSGSGGGGGGTGATGGGNNVSGGGGAAGGYIQAVIPNPLSSYSYTVGTFGTLGTQGAVGGFPGADGGAGYIEIREFYC